MGGMNSEGWNEAGLHAWLALNLPGTELGGRHRRPIHDAAVLEFGGAALASCCDRTEQGVHFTAEASMLAVAHKAVGRSLSDLAATAAKPIGLLLALAAPRGFPESELRALLAAVIERGRALGAPLLGGDLTAAGTGLSLVVTALGQAPADAPGRDRLAPGDWVCLTGPVGGSRLRRHLFIEPQLRLGQALWAAGARAMMDVSDGLALDLSRLARASGVIVELSAIPVHADAEQLALTSGKTAIEHALFDGEDHELLVGGAPEWVSNFAGELWPIARVRAAVGAELPGLHMAAALAPSSPTRPLPEVLDMAAFDANDPRVYIHGR